MHRGVYFFVLILAGLGSVPASFAQNTARGNSLGLQLSYWNMHNRSLRFSSSGRESSFDVNGVGAWLNYSSRISPAWHLDFSLGAFASARGQASDFGAQENVEATAVVPFVFGLRYNLLPHRLTNSFQPYKNYF